MKTLILILFFIGSLLCGQTIAGTGVPYYPYLDHLMTQEREDHYGTSKFYWQQWNLRQLQKRKQLQRQRFRQKKY